ncbi:hypothetical protein [Nocardia fluminea]
MGAGKGQHGAAQVPAGAGGDHEADVSVAEQQAVLENPRGVAG